MKKNGKIVKTLPNGYIEVIEVEIPKKKTRKQSAKKDKQEEEKA